MTDTAIDGQPVGAVLLWATVAIALIAVTSFTGVWAATGLAVAGGIALTATVGLAAQPTPGGRAFGSLLAIATSVLLIGAIGLAAASAGDITEIILFTSVTGLLMLATYGAAAARTGSLGGGSTLAATRLVQYTMFPLLGYALWYSPIVRTLDGFEGIEPAIRLDAWLDRAEDSFAQLWTAQSSVEGVITLFVLLMLFWGTINLVVPRITIHEPLPARARRAIDRGLAITRRRVNHLLIGGGALVLGSVIALILLELITGRGDPVIAATFEDALRTAWDGLRELAGIVAIRWLLGGVMGLAWLAWLASQLPRLARVHHGAVGHRLPAMAGGMVAAGLIHVGYPRLFQTALRPGIEAGGAPAVLIATLGSSDRILAMLAPPSGYFLLSVALVALLGSLYLVLLGIVTLRMIGLLPDRNAAGALTAATIVGAALVIGLIGPPTALIAIVVVCGIIAWDVTRHAREVREDLGPASGSAAVTLAHASGAVFVGMVTILIVITAEQVATEIEPPVHLAVGMAVGLAVVLAFLAVLRRTKRVSA